jgi:4-hydroxy-3-methylbut-2-enyl diphosphate reductase
MQVKVAKTAGFCWGVRRTVDQLMEVAHERHTPVVTLGPIIHNPQFVARTREMGVSPRWRRGPRWWSGPTAR